MLTHLLRDMRLAIRQLIQAPGFAIVAIFTLALGIGATSVIFSVVNGVLLRPLPYPQPERLMLVNEIVPQYGRFSVAPATFFDWRQQNGAFEGIAAFTGGSATILGSDGPERVPSAGVSAGFFEVLAVAPLHGRPFVAAADVPGGPDEVVISHGLWLRRFGGNPAIVGQSVNINSRPFTITGVMPAGFYFPNRETELWLPLALNPANPTRGGHFLGVVARTKPGVQAEQADAEIKTIAARIGQAHPQFANESAEVVPLHERVVGSIRPALLTLLAGVGVVILIACANVANLLLVRASVREREIAVRTALGAGRARIALQMVAESLVLAAAGGVLGLLCAFLAIPIIQQLGAGSIPRVNDVAIDLRVLAFAAGVTLLTGVLFGLAPAWHASRPGISGILKEGGRGSTAGRGRWMRSTLLVGEVALSIVLLVAAALLLRSFARLTSVDPGFDADGVLAFNVSLPRTIYAEPHQQTRAMRAVLEKLEALPQVTSAGMVQTLPIRGDYMLSFTVQGRPAPAEGEEPSANYRAISEGYFQTLNVPLLRGRTFTDRDDERAPMVAIVDKAFVDRHFPNEDPIGRGIDIGNGTDGFYEIAGVVGSVHHGGLDAEATPTMYVPVLQDSFGSMWFVARTEGEPSQLAGAARQAVREVDPTVPAALLMPLTEVISDSIAQRRFSMLLLGAFALIALILAAVGLYGVVAYTVTLRAQEIGVRMAIGAQARDVFRLVVGGGLTLALVGIAIGIAAALALSRYIKSLLFEVTPFDAASYAGTALVLLAVALIASYIPARRAVRIDPIAALRNE